MNRIKPKKTENKMILKIKGMHANIFIIWVWDAKKFKLNF